MRRIARRTRVIIGYALGTIAIVFFCTYAGLLLFDRWVNAPRQTTLRSSVEQSQQNGDNLCQFAVATADAFAALAKSSDLTSDQRDAVDNMVAVAHRCRARTPAADD